MLQMLYAAYLILSAIIVFIFINKLIVKRREVNNVKFNDIAKVIAQTEGKKTEVNIAQIKEVLKLTLEVIANLDYAEAAELLKKYQYKGEK